MVLRLRRRIWLFDATLKGNPSRFPFGRLRRPDPSGECSRTARSGLRPARAARSTHSASTKRKFGPNHWAAASELPLT